MIDGKAIIHYLDAMATPAFTPIRATPTRKGQVTLRRGLLDHLGVGRGEAIEFVPLPGGRLEVRPAARTGSWDAFFGSMKHDGTPALTIDEMNEVIAKGWAGELDEPDD